VARKKGGVAVADTIEKSLRFPKHLASSTMERDGRTYYFVDEETRPEFEQQPATPCGRVGNESFVVASKT
jgi:YHS domain-containing protein